MSNPIKTLRQIQIEQNVQAAETAVRAALRDLQLQRPTLVSPEVRAALFNILQDVTSQELQQYAQLPENFTT